MSPALQNLLDQLDESESDSVACILRLLGGDTGVQLAQLAQLSAIAAAAGPSEAPTLSALFTVTATGAWADLPSYPATEVSVLNLSPDIILLRTDPATEITIPVNMSVSISVVANSDEIQITGTSGDNQVQVVATL